MEMGVIFAAFCAMLLWALGDFLIQRSTRKIGDLESLAFIGIIGSVALIPFIIGDFSLLFSASKQDAAAVDSWQRLPSAALRPLPDQRLAG